jgi:hypothetical protein
MKPTIGTYNRDHLVGIIFVILVILVQTFAMGIAIIFLNIGLIFGFLFWAIHSKRLSNPNILAIYLIAVGFQSLHFLEEYLSGFQAEFPQFFGYSWSDHQFVIFNLLWLCVLIFNGVGVYYGIRLSYLLVYFFVIVGGIANGVAHPLLSLMKGGYFPGLYTSPIVLVIGVVLLLKLLKNQNSASDLS